MLFELGTLAIGVEGDIKGFRDSLTQAASLSQKRARQIKNNLREVGRVGKDLTQALTIPLGGFFAGAINEGRKFETTMVGVAKTSNLTAEQTAALGNSIRKLAKDDLPIGVNQLGQIAEAAGQLGVSGKNDLLAFTDTIARLGQASDLHGADAAKTLARLLTIAKESNSEVGVLGSVIVRLGNSFAASESEIAEMATSIAQATAAYTVSSAEAAALGAALKAVGENAEKGGTQIGRTFRAIEGAILKGGDTLNKYADIIGITGDELERSFGEDQVGVFTKFIGGLKNIQDQGKSVVGTLKDLGLNNDRILSVLPTLVTGYDKLTGALAQASDETMRNSALIEESDKAFTTFDSDLQRLKASFVDLGIAVANSGLLKNISELVKSASNFVGSLGDLDPKILSVVGRVAALSAVMGPLLIVVGQVGLGIRALIGLKGVLLTATSGLLAPLQKTAASIGAVGLRATATAAATGALRGALALLGGPLGIGLAVAGFIAFSTHATDAESQNQRLRNSLQQLGAGGLIPAAGATDELIEKITNLNIVTSQRAIEGFTQKLIENKKEIDDTARRIESLTKVLDLGGQLGPAAAKINDEISTLKENLELARIEGQTLDIQLDKSKIALNEAKFAATGLSEVVVTTTKKGGQLSSTVKGLTAQYSANTGAIGANQRALTSSSRSYQSELSVRQQLTFELRDQNIAYLEQLARQTELDSQLETGERTLEEYNGLLGKNTDLIEDNAGVIGETWTGVYDDASNTLRDFFEENLGEWGSFASGVLDIIVDLGSRVGGTFGSIVEGISGLFSGSGGSGDLLGTIVNGLVGSSSGGVDVGSIVSGILGGSGGGSFDLGSILSNTGGAGEGGGGGFSLGSGGTFGGIGGVIANNFLDVINGQGAATTIAGSLLNGTQLGSALTGTIAGNFLGLADAAGGVATALVDVGAGISAIPIGQAGTAAAQAGTAAAEAGTQAASQGFNIGQAGNIAGGALGALNIYQGLEQGGTAGGFQAVGGGVSLASSLGFLPALGPWGVAIGAVIALLGGLGGARSPQELGLDQLQEVDEATIAGRNENVALGDSAGVAVSFLGGFDENSTFFGIDKAREDLQQIGDVLVERFGFDQALALRDGVIRLEDFSRDFSENNDQIVAEVKAATAEVELSLSEIERSTLGSIGGALVEVDRLFDASAGNGESTAERIAQAYSKATNSTIEASREWVRSTSIDADRIGSIFDATSAGVTEALFGLTENGTSAFNQLATDAEFQAQNITQSFSTNLQGLSGILNSVDLGVARGAVNIPQTTITTNAANTPIQAQPPAASQQAQSQGVSTALETEMRRIANAIEPVVELATAASINGR